MKKLFLVLLLACNPLHGITVDELLDATPIKSPEQRMFLLYICHTLDKLSIADRSVVYIYLKDLLCEEDTPQEK